MAVEIESKKFGSFLILAGLLVLIPAIVLRETLSLVIGTGLSIAGLIIWTRMSMKKGKKRRKHGK